MGSWVAEVGLAASVFGKPLALSPPPFFAHCPPPQMS